MIKQLPSKEVAEYVKNNPKCVLLDVRTEEEWSSDGRPDGEKIGLKTLYLSIQFADKSFNKSFEEEFSKLNIGQDHEILTMCMGGVRSQAAAELITNKNFKGKNLTCYRTTIKFQRFRLKY